MVRFNPQLVVIGSGQNMTLNSVFQLTYSIFSGDALITDTPLGNVTIDEPTLNTLVHCLHVTDDPSTRLSPWLQDPHKIPLRPGRH